MAKKKKKKQQNKEKVQEKKEAAKENDTKEGQVEQPIKKGTLKQEHKQFIYVMIIIAVLFVSFLVPYFYVKNQRVFDYNGLTWQVEQDGEVTFYHTQFAKFYRGEFRGTHNTFLRNDPRKNEVQYDIERLGFFRDIAITTDKELLDCPNQILVTDALAQMSQGIAFIEDITFGITDEELANNSNRNFITCEEPPLDTTVIHVKAGTQSRITEAYDGDCIIVEIGTCEENLITAEKLVIEVIKEFGKEGTSANL